MPARGQVARVNSGLICLYSWMASSVSLMLGLGLGMYLG